MELIIDWIVDTVLGFSDSLTGLADILTKDFNGTALWTIVENVQFVLKPICYTILAFFFLVELIKLNQKLDVMKWEYIFMLIIKVVLAKVVIDIAPEFLNLLYSTSCEWITGILSQTSDYGLSQDIIDNAKSQFDKVQSSYSTVGIKFEDLSNDQIYYSYLASTLRTLLDDMGFLELLAVGMTALLQMIIVMLCGLVVKVIAYGRMIELLVMYAVSPIACAFIFDGEGQSNITKRYAMNFFAICLQGVFIIIASRIYSAFMIDELSKNGLTSWSEISKTILLGAIALVLCISKCGDWARRLLNAN